MYRDSYYDKIIEIIKDKPRSQNEIYKKLDKNKISLQGIAKHLKQGTENGTIIYLGNKVPKTDAKLLLKEYFKDKKGNKLNLFWPTNAWQCYIYMSETKKFYERLTKRSKQNSNIRKIILLYSVLELSAMFQKVWYESIRVMRRDFKARGKKFTDKEIDDKITRRKKKVMEFYENRDKKDPILKFLQFTPLMYWCAFKRPIPIEAKEYDPIRDLVLLKDDLFNKLNNFVIS